MSNDWYCCYVWRLMKRLFWSGCFEFWFIQFGCTASCVGVLIFYEELTIGAIIARYEGLREDRQLIGSCDANTIDEPFGDVVLQSAANRRQAAAIYCSHHSIIVTQQHDKSESEGAAQISIKIVVEIRRTTTSIGVVHSFALDVPLLLGSVLIGYRAQTDLNYDSNFYDECDSKLYCDAVIDPLLRGECVSRIIVQVHWPTKEY